MLNHAFGSDSKKEIKISASLAWLKTSNESSKTSLRLIKPVMFVDPI